MRGREKKKEKEMPRLLLRMLFLFVIFSPHHAYAVQPNEVLANPQLESQAREISAELRCLVCQNESIDDSDADLAHDLRLLVRQRLLAGDTDEEVKQYLVNRYGDYVLLKPPFKASTLVLWFAPVVLLAIGGRAASLFYRRRKEKDGACLLSKEEEARLAVLLDTKEKDL